MSLSLEEVQAVVHAFDEANTDNSGGLDIQELRVFLENRGEEVDDEDLAEVYAVYDLNHDGIMSFEEFTRYVADVNLENDWRVLRHRFDAIDLDGDGNLSPNEIMQFQHLCGNMITLDEAVALAHQLDRDRDGRVTFADYVASRTA